LEEVLRNESRILELTISNKEINNPETGMSEGISRYQNLSLTSALLEILKTYTFAFWHSTKGITPMNENEPIVMLLKSLPEERMIKIFDSISANSDIKNKMLKSYYLMYLMCSNINDISYYHRFKKYLYSVYSSFPRADLKLLHENLYTSIYFINDKKFERDSEILDAYKFKFENQLMCEPGDKLDPTVFQMWSGFLFLNGKVKELDDFVSSYREKIEGQDREEIIAISEVYLLHMKGENKEALNVLARINFRFIGNKFNLKKIKMMILYKLDDFEAFLQETDAYNHFLEYNVRNGKIDKVHCERAKEFVRYLDKLFELRGSRDVSGIEIFEKEISEKGINFNKWFLIQTSEIKASIPVVKRKRRQIPA